MLFLKQVWMTNKSYPSIITERNGMKEITFPKVLICSHSMHSKKRLRKYYPQITGKLHHSNQNGFKLLMGDLFQTNCCENFMAKQSQNEHVNFGTSLWYQMWVLIFQIKRVDTISLAHEFHDTRRFNHR